MAEKRHKPDEIVTKLRRLDVLRGHPARELEPPANPERFMPPNVLVRSRSRSSVSPTWNRSARRMWNGRT